MVPPYRPQKPLAAATMQQTTLYSLPQCQLQSQSSTSSGSQTQTPQSPSLGMTPASRYTHNLKVLRRRDSSILSIFDQFSHVCVYHHDGQKWEKHGYEGSMFLFERNFYPPYGFYIMNRVGMEDYVQPLYPEDELAHSGNYLIIRSYPDFLDDRLARIKASHPGMQLDKFADVYSIPNIEELDSKSKGRSSIIALWMHTDDTRESLIDVMRKLHTYIRQNVPYPDEFRYSPGRPPPPNRLRAIPKKIAGSTSDSQAHRLHSDSENDQSYYSDAPSTSIRGLTAIDKLFSKLGTSHSNFVSASPSGKACTPNSDAVKTTISPTVSSTGISLLDDIFASAATLPAPVVAETGNFQPSNNIDIQPSTIFSPQPSTGASGPQILNAQVLNNILTGSTPSRASSVVSHPSSREGDNEDDGKSDSPPPVLDEDSDCQTQLPQTGPNVARVTGTDHLNTFGFRPGQKIHGDVTPRPPWNGLHPTLSANDTSSLTARRTSNTPSAPPPCPVPDANPKTGSHRPLVPFESDSELWPYKQRPDENRVAIDDDCDIVELNFEETSVLSDPEAFTRVLKQKKSAIALRESDILNAIGRVNGNSSASVEKGKGKNRRKTKKERDAKEKEEIENGWDLPLSASALQGVGMELVFGKSRALTPPSPAVSTEKSSSSVPAAEIKTPTMTATLTLTGHDVNSTGFKAKRKTLNGYSKVNGHEVVSALDPEAVKDGIIHAIEAQARPVSSVDKNEFMREVVNLIRIDKTFVEKIYQEYMARRV